MSIGDFVVVHFKHGWMIGQLIVIDKDTVSVAFDHHVVENIPIELCSVYE